jgi:hypothetical protein
MNVGSTRHAMRPIPAGWNKEERQTWKFIAQPFPVCRTFTSALPVFMQGSHDSNCTEVILVQLLHARACRRSTAMQALAVAQLQCCAWRQKPEHSPLHAQASTPAQ